MEISQSAKAAPPEPGLGVGGLFPVHFVYVLRSLTHPNRTYTGRVDGTTMSGADWKATRK